MSSTEYYLGNQRLKRANVPVNYSKKEIEEFVKCSRDVNYFVKQYIKIVSVDKGIINFDLWPFQEEMVNVFINNRFSICKLPRQVGKTTVVAATILWYVLFHENYSVAILANKLAQAREILGRIQLAYENLPKWLQQGVVEWNKGNIVLENGSKILASSTSSSAIRGTSQNLIYLDEFAFVPAQIQGDFFASVYPTISSGNTTKVIITSTPKGLNIFYKLWTEAEQGKNTFVPFSVHWSDVPGRDQKWKEETIKNTSEQQFREEFDCEFIGSTNTLINPNKLLQLASVRPMRSDEHFAIYEDPSLPENKNKLYVVVVDTSRGVGGDYSAFAIFDVSSIPYRVVGRYKNNEISPLLFPNIIYQFAKVFNDAYVCVEVNDNGQQVADILYRELEYENMIFSQFKGRAGQSMSSGFGMKPAVGVRTTKLLKRVGCTNLKSLVESEKLIIEDNEIINELFQFVEVGESYQAEEGAHDDLVMCCVIFGWLVQQPYFKDWTDTNVRERLVRENLQLIDEDLLPMLSNQEDFINTTEIVEISDRAFNRFLLED